MKPRQGLVEVFSTFLQLDADYFKGWLTDPKLRRNIQQCVDRAPQLEFERVWMLHWHQVWQTESSAIAADHLAAYLQEVGYWSAHKIAINFPSSQSLSDLFQTAIVGMPKVLKTFNRDLSPHLKSYAGLIFSNLIKDVLRQQQTIDICSDWSLLNRLSQKALVEALQAKGLGRSTIAAYVLTWNCFRELAAPMSTQSTQKQTKPEAATWSAIAALYTTQSLIQLDSPCPKATPASVEQWLLICAAAVRAFRLPQVISANAPQYDQETVEFLDNLPSREEPGLNQMIADEAAVARQVQNQQIHAVLEAAIAQLDPPLQTLLKTYYGQGLTQQQIAQQLGVKQYSISRRLSSARACLLRALAQWSQDTLHLSLTPQVLDSMTTVLEEWLQARAQGVR